MSKSTDEIDVNYEPLELAEIMRQCQCPLAEAKALRSHIVSEGGSVQEFLLTMKDRESEASNVLALFDAAERLVILAGNDYAMAREVLESYLKFRND